LDKCTLVGRVKESAPIFRIRSPAAWFLAQHSFPGFYKLLTAFLLIGLVNQKT